MLTTPEANVKCTPSTPAPPRKRRRPNQDLQERLARCEELLSQYAAEKPEHRASQLRAYGSDQSLQWQPTGKLVRENGSMRFMDSPLLGNVYDEVSTLAPHPRSWPPPQLTAGTLSSSEP